LDWTVILVAEQTYSPVGIKKARRLRRVSYISHFAGTSVAAGPGFEPGLTDPESGSVRLQPLLVLVKCLI
jgi:hypothetical protein